MVDFSGDGANRESKSPYQLPADSSSRMEPEMQLMPVSSCHCHIFPNFFNDLGAFELRMAREVPSHQLQRKGMVQQPLGAEEETCQQVDIRGL